VNQSNKEVILMQWLAIIIGGGLGSICRFGLSAFVSRLCGEGMAWGTLGVNLLGCLFIGALTALIERGSIPESVRFFAITGFLGGFTTFSAYAWESVRYMHDGMFARALVNLFLNNIGGLLLAAAGWVIVRKMLAL